MTTEARAFATEIDGILFGAESCAWTVHHPGHMTIAGYRRLDRVEPWEITGIARVKTKLIHESFEYSGSMTLAGWSTRT